MLKIVEERKTGSEYILHGFVDDKDVAEVWYRLCVFNSHTAVIMDLGVAEAYRKKGIATALVKEAVKQIFSKSFIRDIIIYDGSEGNITARIVTKLGFKWVGSTKYKLTKTGQ